VTFVAALLMLSTADRSATSLSLSASAVAATWASNTGIGSYFIYFLPNDWISLEREGLAPVKVYGTFTKFRKWLVFPSLWRKVGDARPEHAFTRLCLGNPVRALTGKDGCGRIVARCDVIGLDLNRATTMRSPSGCIQTTISLRKNAKRAERGP
jgi:hypothetical protein